MEELLQSYKKKEIPLSAVLKSEHFDKIIHSWTHLHDLLTVDGNINYRLLYTIIEANPKVLYLIPIDNMIDIYNSYPVPKEIMVAYFENNPHLLLQLSKEELSRLLYAIPTLSNLMKLGWLMIVLEEPIDYKLIGVIIRHGNNSILSGLSSEEMIQLCEKDKTILDDIPIDKLASFIKNHENVISFLSNKRAHALLRYDKNILNQHFIPFMDDGILREIGMKDTVNSKEAYLQEIKDDVTTMVTLCAICHGGPYTIQPLPVSLTRIAESPWNICSFSSGTQRLDKRRKICANHNQDKLEIYPEATKNLVMTKEDLDWEKRASVMKDRDAPDIHFFKKGDEMIYKRFEEKTDGKYDAFRFLLVKGNTRCFNLFSIKEKWNMEEILNLFPNAHVIFVDHSCSLLPPHLASLPPERLQRLGGTRTRTSRTSRTRFTRKSTRASFR